MIGIIGTQLNQWDVGRSVTVAGITADHVHFANKGDSKAVIMELVEGQAKIPDYLLQSGKQICAYVVANGVTVESKSFYVIQRERPENYVYKDDQRNYIYELITDAQTATEAAKQATQNANEAADKANQAAKSWVIMGEVKGESMVIDDAIDQSFAGFRIFGKTIQNGVPTPDAPVDLVSVENPTIEVNEQSMLVPYALHGIPVSSGGNYTDATGQQWICDEVDFGRGAYVKRIGELNVNKETVYSSGVTSSGTSYNFYIKGEVYDIAPDYKNRSIPAICSKFIFADSGVNSFALGTVESSGWGGVARFVFRASPNVNTVALFKEYVGDDCQVLYQLKEEIHTALSKEDLAAYAALHTSRYGTTVSNDQNAYMNIHYVMDAKEYIDRKVASSFIYPATIG